MIRILRLCQPAHNCRPLLCTYLCTMAKGGIFWHGRSRLVPLLSITAHCISLTSPNLPIGSPYRGVSSYCNWQVVITHFYFQILAVNTGAKWREQNVDTSPFYTSKEIDRLIGETETAVTSELEGGDRQKAMKRLRVPPLNEQKSPWTTFKVGLFSGAFIVLFIAAVLSGNNQFGCPVKNMTSLIGGAKYWDCKLLACFFLLKSQAE